MSLHSSFPIPYYCEHAGAHGFAEPANVVTSLAMLVSAAISYSAWKRQGEGDRVTLLLVLCVVLIGLGSFSFHTTRSSIALFLDVVPTVLFMLVAFYIILTRLCGQTPLQTGLHMAGFCAANLMVTLVISPRAMGFGAWFVVPLVTLYALGAWLILTGRLGMHEDRTLAGRAAAESDRRHFPQIKMGYAVIQSGLLVALGLVARAYDQKLCSVLPFGLHAVWHVLVASAVTVLCVACIRYARVPQSASHHAV